MYILIEPAGLEKETAGKISAKKRTIKEIRKIAHSLLFFGSTLISLLV